MCTRTITATLLLILMSYCGIASGRFVTSDPVGLQGGLNTYTYVNNNPLRYIDPDGLVTSVIIVKDFSIGTNFSIGTHVAVRVDNSGKPVLFDPAGNFCSVNSPCGVRGTGDALFGKDADIVDFINFHTSVGSTVTIIPFNTTPEQEAEIARKINKRGGAAPFACSTAVSGVLSGTEPFKDLPIQRLPGNLEDELLKIRGR